MEDSILGSSNSEKDLGVMVDNHLNMSSRCDTVVKRANVILGWVNRGILKVERLFYTCIWYWRDHC